MLRFAITDRRLFFDPASSLAGALSGRARTALVARCAELSADGVDFILVREKDLPAGELAGLCCEIAAAVRAAGAARILVAGRPDIALAARLDGVHLSAAAGELTPAQAREVPGRRPGSSGWVSVSCHSPAEVARAAADQADAILFGPVFGKTVAGSVVVPAAGPGALAEAVRAAGAVPVLALGGVTAENTAVCLQQGAAGVAAIRLYFAGGSGS